MSYSIIYWGFPGGSDNKESTHNVADWGFDPWVRNIPWRREWLQIPQSSLENLIDRGAWQATVHGVVSFITQHGWYKSHYLLFFLSYHLYSQFSSMSPSPSSFLLRLSESICIFCLCIFCCCLNKHAHFSRSNTYPTSSTSHFKKNNWID